MMASLRSPVSLPTALIAALLVGGVGAGCPAGDVIIDPPGGEGEGEGEGTTGEGEGEGELIAATNDTCADPITLDDGIAVSMPAFTATASRRNCSATNDAGDDGIEDVAFVFVLDAPSDVSVVADGAVGDTADDSYVSPTLTLFDTPLCAFPQTHTVDDRTCVGDGLTFDAPTVMTVSALPAGTWFVVAETFGDLSPFTIRFDRLP